jgi:hypothetical protein
MRAKFLQKPDPFMAMARPVPVFAGRRLIKIDKI